MTLNGKEISSEIDLSRLLDELGIVNEPLNPEWKFLPSYSFGRLIFSDRQFEEGGPVVVAIINEAIEVYWYDWHEVYFMCGHVFKGDVKENELCEAIVVSGSKEPMLKTYG